MYLEPDMFPLADGNTPLVRRLSLHSNQTINFDLGDVWESITGEYFAECFWVNETKYENIDKTKPSPYWSKDAWTPEYKVTLYFDEYEGKSEATLTANDFAQSYAKLAFDGWRHCGTCSIDDPDACVVDAVVQHAIFGKDVFG